MLYGKKSFRKSIGVLVAVLAAVMLLTTSMVAAAEPEVIVVNDSDEGTGLNQFEYVDFWASNAAGSKPNFHNGDNHYSQTEGYVLQIRFEGTKIEYYGSLGPGAGILAWSIDGGPETEVDGYSAEKAEGAKMFEVSGLSAGEHILKVRVTGKKNDAATAAWVNADKVVITKAAAPAPATNTSSNPKTADTSVALYVLSAITAGSVLVIKSGKISLGKK